MLLEALLSLALAAADDELLAVEPAKVKALWTPKRKELRLAVHWPVDFRAGCAVVSYIIERDGKPSNVKVLRSVPEGDVGELAATVVKRGRYEPTKANAARMPVYTYTTVTFNQGKQPRMPIGTRIAPSIDFDALDSACAVSGFAGLDGLERGND